MFVLREKLPWTELNHGATFNQQVRAVFHRMSYVELSQQNATVIADIH